MACRLNPKGLLLHGPQSLFCAQKKQCEALRKRKPLSSAFAKEQSWKG